MTEQQTSARIRDRVRGCLAAGAAGDALGYAVEFSGEDRIFARFGDGGIRAFAKDRLSGLALISDDSQMTMFTAEGILNAGSRPFRKAVADAYLDWLVTQEGSFEAFNRALLDGESRRSDSMLLREPALYANRAPGNTCLSALWAAREEGDPSDLDYIAHPRNHSKGCGGVMRVAPAAFLPGASEAKICMEAAQMAAVTHGNPLGWLPAAALALMVRGMAFTDLPLRRLAQRAMDTLRSEFGAFPQTEELCTLLSRALELAGQGGRDLANIHALGEGWVGDEALAIALYCAVRHEANLSACLIAAVNHRGDSDSTGAVAGNLLGARVGFAAMDDRWKKDLELLPQILELADRLSEKL